MTDIKTFIKGARKVLAGAKREEKITEAEAIIDFAKHKFGNDTAVELRQLLGVMPYGYWTLERCKADALKYATKQEWREANVSAYSIAKANKWIDLCCATEAKRYTSARQWCEGSGSSYNAALKNGWLDECSAHMPKRATSKSLAK